MVIWQFRQLLLSREIVDEGGNIGDLMSRECTSLNFRQRNFTNRSDDSQYGKLKWVYRR